MRGVAVLLLGLSLGCATYPRTFGCSDVGLSPLVESTGRMGADGFSIQLPSDARWCLQQVSDSSLMLMTHPLIGRYLKEKPSPSEIAHTIGIVVFEAEIENESPETAQELQDFVERWYQTGGSGGAIHGRMVMTAKRRAPRFTPLHSEIRADPFRGATCIWHLVKWEERGQPRLPSAVLELSNEGFMCVHPARPGKYVYATFTERFVRGQRTSADLSDRLREQGIQVVRSLSFEP